MNKNYKYFSKNKISYKGKRRFAIGDIHGCFNTFKTLLEDKINIEKDDQIFLLGDYIDKGKYSKETVDYIIDLIKKGYKIFPLLGNHEEEKINIHRYAPELLSWLTRKAKNMLNGNQLKPKYSEFFESLPYFYETDDFLFVHAAFDFCKEKPFENKLAMMQIRRFENDTKITKGRTIIHGHQPMDIDIIENSIKNRKNVIGLDCGINYTKPHRIYNYKKMGRLCALNLDTYKLHIQKNIDDITI